MLRRVNDKYYIDLQEVTKEQYDEALQIIRSKSKLADEIIAGIKTIDDVPVEWVSDVQLIIESRSKKDPLVNEVSAQDIVDALEGLL